MKKILPLTMTFLIAFSIFPLFTPQIEIHSFESNKTTLFQNNFENYVAEATIDNDDWAMFRHDPAHTSFSTSTAPNTNNTFWSYDVGDSRVYSPAIVNGKVFASYISGIVALDEPTGKLIWHYPADYIKGSSPAVAYGKVFVGGGVVYALNERDGTLIWKRQLKRPIVGSSPAISNRKVFIVSTGGAQDPTNAIYALKEATGEILWSFTDELIGYSPAVSNSKVFVVSGKRVYALDEDSGTVVWISQELQSIPSSPTIANGRVFVGGQLPYHRSIVYALDEDTGTVIWSSELDWGPILSTPAIAYSKVFVGTGSSSNLDKGKVYALNETSGTLLWSLTTGGPASAGLAVADGKLFVGVHWESRFYALSESSGTVIWSYELEPGHFRDSLSSNPAIANGKVFIGGLEGILIAFGQATYELFFEIDYIEGHEPTESVLTYITYYYLTRDISVTFYIDDLVPFDDSVTDDEFWAIEAIYNDHDFGYYSKWKWVLFGSTVDGDPHTFGYTWTIGTETGNYIFIADQTGDDYAAAHSDVTTTLEVEALVLMHEMGHTIGILLLDKDGNEKYDGNPWSVMTTVDKYKFNKALDERYSVRYWNERNMEYYET